MRKGTPNQLINELTSKIAELKGSNVRSSAYIIEEEDTITADEEIMDIPQETTTDYDAYFDQIQGDVEQKIEDLVVSVAWNSDEENIYMDANFIDGHVITFTIPKADLAYDLENTDMDVEYICQAVRDTAESENEPVLELEAPADEELPVYM